jgi:hypothetical protein
MAPHKITAHVTIRTVVIVLAQTLLHTFSSLLARRLLGRNSYCILFTDRIHGQQPCPAGDDSFE